MSPNKVKEETDDRIVLVDSVAKKVVSGLSMIFGGLFFFWIFFPDGFVSGNVFYGSNDEIAAGLINLFGGGLGGGLFIFMGLHTLLVKETIIIDKKLQRTVIIKETPTNHFKSIKKIPFSDLKIIEITYDTQCKNCDYDSPVDGSNESWDISLIRIGDGSVKIYQGDSKPEVEKIAESICKITGKMITHRTEYNPIPGC